MKKIKLLTALTLAAGCALACTGCGGSSKNIASLDSNWYSGVNFTHFQPTFTEGNKDAAGNAAYSAEVIEYAVAFDGSTAANPTYTVEYPQGGTYTTTFTSKILGEDEIEKITLDEHRGYYNSKTMQVYYYKTELTIPEVKFTLKSDNTKTATLQGDSIVTENYFLSVADYLSPVYSKQTVKSATPRNYQISDINAAYVLINREYESFYLNKNNSPVEVVTKTTVKNEQGFADYGYADFEGTENGNAKTSTANALNIENTANTLFDVSALNVVARACKLTSGANLSQAINLYVPWSNAGVTDFGIAGSAAPLVLDKTADDNTAKLTELTSKLQTAGLYEEKKDAEGKTIGLQTVAVNVGTKAGVTQTYWFAAVTSTHDNVGHATMLKLSTPVAFGLGTLNYTLKTIHSTFIS
ncbi:MAG: hypothetical protein K2L67_03450 [Clostridia bacterium]|nr:hypothetical protein [Clostridia bacterium]